MKKKKFTIYKISVRPIPTPTFQELFEMLIKDRKFKLPPMTYPITEKVV